MKQSDAEVWRPLRSENGLEPDSSREEEEEEEEEDEDNRGHLSHL